MNGGSYNASLVTASPRVRRIETEDRTGRHPEEGRRPARVLDQGVDVVDLALDRVRRRVAAVASTATVVVVPR